MHLAAAAPALTSAAGRAFMDRLCMPEVLAMVVPQGQEDVSSSLGADGGAICGGVSASSEAGEEAKGGFLGGGNARQVHNTA
jgi:hypothetical protein